MRTKFLNKSPNWGIINGSAMLTSIIMLCMMMLASPAQAQNMIPMPGGLGLTIGGWSQSSGISTGQVTGGDGRGVVSTVTEGGIKLKAESFVTGNNNPACTVACSDSQTKLSILGELLAGGRVSNQGVGPGLVTSTMGTNQMMSGSVNMFFAPTPAPVVQATRP